MYIFGRDAPSSYSPLGQAALECTRDPEPSVRAIGWNILSDHRVTDTRAEHFFEVSDRPATANQLKRALVDYFRDWVCLHPQETYLSEIRNQTNFVHQDVMTPDTLLVHVLNVDAWVNYLTVESPASLALRNSLPRLNQRPFDARLRDEFIRELLRQINIYRDQR